MNIDRAFNPSRALNHGLEAFKLAPFPLFLGAFLMWMSESAGGSSGNFGDLGELFDDSDGGDDFDWSGGDDFNYRLGAAASRLWARAPLDLRVEDFTQLLEGLGLPSLEGIVIAAILTTMLCVIVMSLVFFAFRCWISVGYIRLQQQVITTGEGEFGALFGGGDRWLDMVLWRLLAGVISVGATLTLALPGGAVGVAGVVTESEPLMVLGLLIGVLLWIPGSIYISLGLYLGNQALIIEGLSPMEALDRSWTMASGNRGTFFIYALFMTLVALAAMVLGLAACCVGIFVIGPIARAVIDLGVTESYLMHIEGEEQAQQWALTQRCGGLD